jgi:nitroreductase
MPETSPMTTPFMPNPTPSAPPSGGNLLCLLESRRSVKPVDLGEPGPTADELRRILTVACRVPDHGVLVPWRFILFQGEARQAASTRLAALYAAQNPDLSERTLGMLRKLSRLFTHAPLVVAVVSRADPKARKPEWEQVLTVGAVCMNLIAATTALGYASVWLTGWVAYDAEALRTLGVRPEEKIAGLVHIGSARERPPDRRRPSLDDLVTSWKPQ